MKVEITRKKLLEEGEACVAILIHCPRFEGRISVSSGSQQRGTLISASAVPHCGLLLWDLNKCRII